ncbi:MAG TPA: hypothetical protein VME01_07770 [Solirubrobacteraceae bacterium]|nr:hypothetical protein [Solirubrobacteraceae bacterium]
MPTHEANARAGLAGNPSDGYGGAVLAVTIPAFSARVAVAPLVGPLATSGERPALIDATLARFAREFGQAGEVEAWETSIPRSVGLGGSSAIVIATLRGLCELHDIAIDPADLAELALSIERDDLGIAAGLQDRVAQSYGGLTFMEFSKDPPAYERLDPGRLPPLLVAWRTHTAEHSGVVHNDLRTRWESGDPVIRHGMHELAESARDARAAVLLGDGAVLARCATESYEVRKRMMTLDPRHVEMVEVARAAGAGVNYTGSGGAIICVCSDAGHRERVAAALRAAACETVAVG